MVTGTNVMDEDSITFFLVYVFVFGFWILFGLVFQVSDTENANC